MQNEYYGSVIIPAHNEQKVIGRCLELLTNGMTRTTASCAFEIVVVCNGCTDETAAIAAKFPNVKVIEISEPSKVAALNSGDNAVTTFPRIYLDADSELSNPSASSLLSEAADHVDPAIFSASVKFDTTECSILARSFSRCAQRTSFGQFGVVGRGVYALNAAGRSRFEKFPGIMGDDYFVASLFNADEQIIDLSATVTVRPPTDLRSLVRVRSRIYYGNREAGLEHSRNLSPHQGWHNLAYAASRARSFSEVFDLAVYAAVNLLAKRTAVKMARSGMSPRWERDDNSRR